MSTNKLDLNGYETGTLAADVTTAVATLHSPLVGLQIVVADDLDATTLANTNVVATVYVKVSIDGDHYVNMPWVNDSGAFETYKSITAGTALSEIFNFDAVVIKYVYVYIDWTSGSGKYAIRLMERS